jgi:hypothetical protein
LLVNELEYFNSLIQEAKEIKTQQIFRLDEMRVGLDDPRSNVKKSKLQGINELTVFQPLGRYEHEKRYLLKNRIKNYIKVSIIIN